MTFFDEIEAKVNGANNIVPESAGSGDFFSQIEEAMGEAVANDNEAKGITELTPDLSLSRLNRAGIEEMKRGVKDRLIGLGMMAETSEHNTQRLRREMQEFAVARGMRKTVDIEKGQYKKVSIDLLAAAASDRLKADPDFNISSGFIEDQMRSLTQLGTQVVIGTIGGPAVAIPDMALMIMGGTFDRLNKEHPNGDRERFKQAAFINAFTQAPVEYAGAFATKVPGMKQGLKYIDKVTKPLQNAATKEIQKRAIGMMGWMAKRVTPEVMTEYWQNITSEEFSQLYAVHPTKEAMKLWVDEVRKAETHTKQFKELGHVALSTLLLRAPGGVRHFKRQTIEMEADKLNKKALKEAGIDETATAEEQTIAVEASIQHEEKKLAQKKADAKIKKHKAKKQKVESDVKPKTEIKEEPPVVEEAPKEKASVIKQDLSEQEAAELEAAQKEADDWMKSELERISGKTVAEEEIVAEEKAIDESDIEKKPEEVIEEKKEKVDSRPEVIPGEVPALPPKGRGGKILPDTKGEMLDVSNKKGKPEEAKTFKVEDLQTPAILLEDGTVVEGEKITTKAPSLTTEKSADELNSAWETLEKENKGESERVFKTPEGKIVKAKDWIKKKGIASKAVDRKKAEETKVFDRAKARREANQKAIKIAEKENKEIKTVTDENKKVLEEYLETHTIQPEFLAEAMLDLNKFLESGKSPKKGDKWIWSPAGAIQKQKASRKLVGSRGVVGKTKMGSGDAAIAALESSQTQAPGTKTAQKAKFSDGETKAKGEVSRTSREERIETVQASRMNKLRQKLMGQKQTEKTKDRIRFIDQFLKGSLASTPELKRRRTAELKTAKILETIESGVLKARAKRESTPTTKEMSGKLSDEGDVTPPTIQMGVVTVERQELEKFLTVPGSTTGEGIQTTRFGYDIPKLHRSADKINNIANQVAAGIRAYPRNKYEILNSKWESSLEEAKSDPNYEPKVVPVSAVRTASKRSRLLSERIRTVERMAAVRQLLLDENTTPVAQRKYKKEMYDLVRQDIKADQKVREIEDNINRIVKQREAKEEGTATKKAAIVEALPATELQYKKDLEKHDVATLGNFKTLLEDEYGKVLKGSERKHDIVKEVLIGKLKQQRADAKAGVKKPVTKLRKKADKVEVKKTTPKVKPVVETVPKVRKYGPGKVVVDIKKPITAADRAAKATTKKKKPVKKIAQLLKKGSAKNFISVINNDRGGQTMTIPGTDTVLSIPKGMAKSWSNLVQKGYDKAGDFVKNAAQSDSRADMFLSSVIEKFGLDYDFKQNKTDYKLQIHKAKVKSMQLAKAIDRIDSIFETATATVFGTPKISVRSDFLEGKKGDQLKAAKRALDLRKKQIAKGSITSFGDKYFMVKEAAREFERLEVDLRERGLLQDHQFRSLTKKERHAGIERVKSLDSQIQEIADSSDSDSIKRKKTAKAEAERKDLIVRLQIHYKNSGSNYLTDIQGQIDQNERYMKRLQMDSMVKKWANRKRNWKVIEKDGVLHVRREHAKSSLSTSELVGKGITQEAHDLHMHDLFLNIARNEESLGLDPKAKASDVRVEIPGAVPWATKYPDKYTQKGKGFLGGKAGVQYTKIPTKHKQFGPLAGMYVENHIYADMQQSFKDVSNTVKQWNKIFSTWKAGKTVWNPATTARNFVSNIALAHTLGDVNVLDPKHWKEFVNSWGEVAKSATGIYVPTNQYAKEILDETRIYDSSFARAELGKDGQDYISKMINRAGDIAPTEALAEIIKGTAVEKGDVGLKSEGIANMGPYIYNQLEVAMKSVVYKNARQSGMTIQEAEAKAHYALFDYSSVPPLIRHARNWYSPFITFSYKAIPRLAKTFVQKPWKMIPYYGITMGANYLAEMMLDEDDDDIESKKRWLPDYINRSMLPYMPSHIRMPFQTTDGRDKYLDLSFWMPWGGATDMAEGALNWIPSAIAPTNPLLTLPGSLLSNHDIFTGRQVVLDTDSGGERMLKIFEKMYNEVAPAVFSFQKFDKIMGAVYGHTNIRGEAKYSVWDAMLDWTVGVKFRNIDYMEQSMWRQKDLQKKTTELSTVYSKKIQDAQYNKKDDPRNPTVQEIMRDYTDKLEDIKDEFNTRWGVENDDE